MIYWSASLLSSWIFPLMTAILPGMAALLHGVFYFPCTLSLLILRKPGAAVYVGIISVLVEILPGNAYNGPMIFVQALVEALCAELAFGIFRYRRWTLGTTILRTDQWGGPGWSDQLVPLPGHRQDRCAGSACIRAGCQAGLKTDPLPPASIDHMFVNL